MLRKKPHQAQPIKGLDQLDLFNQNPIKNASIAEQALKPASSKKPAVPQEDPDRMFKIVSRITLQADGSYKHYDGTGRLCLHSHAPEPKKTAQLKPQPESRQEIVHLTCTGRAMV